MDKFNKIPLEWFDRDCVETAIGLLGKVIVKIEPDGTALSGRIVECEAYLSENDLSSHSACGKTKRNAPMFSYGGTLYVYKIFGIHRCINIVAESAQIGAAVLIRALEPIDGVELMINRRGTTKKENLLKGPGNLAKAFGFDLKDNMRDFAQDDLYLLDGAPPKNIIACKRIGITKSADLYLRFLDGDSRYISKKPTF